MDARRRGARAAQVMRVRLEVRRILYCIFIQFSMKTAGGTWAKAAIAAPAGQASRRAPGSPSPLHAALEPVTPRPSIAPNDQPSQDAHLNSIASFVRNM
ncbi:hypothetical protein [Burkholderia anthina]|uniref:hypothetical protein n=1 Tax=Burkholderia anthina TaxID=179879 RepID=UPI001588564F|nr:hypothetical protein [Burkholderia anthina]